MYFGNPESMINEKYYLINNNGECIYACKISPYSYSGERDNILPILCHPLPHTCIQTSVSISNDLCNSRKYLYSPPQKGLEIPGGWGLSKTKKLKELCMEFNLGISKGWGVLIKKIPSMGEVWIFYGFTQSVFN